MGPLIVVLSSVGLLLAGVGPDPPPDASRAVQRVAADAMRSLVVVGFEDRQGARGGVGSGFVVDPGGLVATNLHVIGEARPVFVQLADGRHLDVVAIEASDRRLDLALVRVAADNLPALKLADSDRLKQGQPVIALGNPFGLDRSVVQGIVSALRPFDGQRMIQIAMPIEPGNSGGPLLDLAGQVQGIVTLKSAFGPNLAFAVPVNQLKGLIERPNPIPMSRWLTIGVIDPDRWHVDAGGHWRQRAGRIIVEGGTGTASLLVARDGPPQPPFELAVTVRLDDTDGAAGLAFGCEGDQSHYAFYPTGTLLRLTRVDGPDPTRWQILDQRQSAHHEPGDWNRLKVQVAPNRIACFVNGQLLLETGLDRQTAGGVGLVAFGPTAAQFRNFTVGQRLAVPAVAAAAAAQINEVLERVSDSGPLSEQWVGALLRHAQESQIVLGAQVRALRRRAEQLHRLQEAVHKAHIREQLVAVLAAPEDRIDLFHAALLIAAMDNPEVDIGFYRRQIDRMADQIRATLPADAGEPARLAALNHHLFADEGYHGSRTIYYHRSNSYINEMLDDREGLPITLSVLYIELARGIGLNVVGAALPGHFMVRHVPAGADPDDVGQVELIDVFDAGRRMSRAQAAERVLDQTGGQLRDEHLAPATKAAIIVRMLRNLMRVAEGQAAHERMLDYLDAIVAIEPDSGQDRFVRAMLLVQSGRFDRALQDIDWLMQRRPPGIDPQQLQQIHEAVRELAGRHGAPAGQEGAASGSD